MQKGDVVHDTEFAYDNPSKMELKRSQQWFIENTEADLFPHKRQAVEVQTSTSLLGMPNSNVAHWGNSSSFHTVTRQFTERLFDADSVRTIDFDDRHITSTGTGNMNVGRKHTDNAFRDDSSCGLYMSQTPDSPKLGLNYSGCRKIKVSEVKDSDNILPVSMGHSLINGATHTMPIAQAYCKPDVNTIPTSLTYDKSHGNIISAMDTFREDDNSFISMGQPFSKQCDISINQDRPNDHTISMCHSFGTGVGHDMSVLHMYSKGQDTRISNNPACDSNMVLGGNSYSKENESPMQLGHVLFSKGDETNIPGTNCYKNESILMGHFHNKGDSSTISFGGYEDEASTGRRLVCNYDLLMGQSPGEKPAAVSQYESAKHFGNVAASAHQGASASGITSKKEDSKTNKDPPDSFPSNVRSLLSTGMLDGVPVKYVAWSREKELHGVIKGTGYLCGCQSCNHSKVINAYEFERHAGCKTKHPNNHIYFESGKTIYGIVQELRSTPQNMLFDVIQTITGSPINQKSFRLWKESFLAATRELQRIYGKGEGNRLP